MGNNSTKESRPHSSLSNERPTSSRNPTSPTSSGPTSSSQNDRLAPPTLYTQRSNRGSRHDLSNILGIGRDSDRDAPAVEARRETKAEREARKREKEREARLTERERSMREEGVDGGYLVTLGVYTGPEDFSKTMVRSLMIERRLAPFWKGLEDHDDAWTEHQLVAAAKGERIPPADEIPPEDPARPMSANPRSSDYNINHLTVPMSDRTMSAASDSSSHLSPSHPAFSGSSLPNPSSPLGSPPSSSPFFRGRAKTLAALNLSSRNNSQADMTPQEFKLPDEPYVNGQRLEAFLYKDASECPICFMYYPPYLNKTRCCDQPICSECFVQIKRPDPHPPEHADPTDPNPPPPSEDPLEECMLVSEPATCPFCKVPEFGITYDPPPFRRGLTHAQQGGHPLAREHSAMSSSSSLNSGAATPSSPGGTRRRNISISATDKAVITTDKIRPDWAKKLSDARAHALRRSAAATALHNAAYMMGNVGSAESSRFRLGRRRPGALGGDSNGSSGQGTPREGVPLNMSALLAAAEARGRPEPGQGDLFPGRNSSRRNRVEDLEELMMMEAIRLSLAAEEERKKKEEKQDAKNAKKEEKQKAKEAKKAEKAARRGSFFPTSPSQDTLGSSASLAASTRGPEPKGKAVDRGYVGFNPMTEPTSVLGTGTSSKEDPQKHLEQRRQQIQSLAPPSEGIDSQTSPLSPLSSEGLSPSPPQHTGLRRISDDASSVSSFGDSAQGSLPNTNGFGQSPNASGLSVSHPASEAITPHGGAGGDAGTEPMFNFRSLAAVIGHEDDEKKEDDSKEHHERAPAYLPVPGSGDSSTRSRGDSGESSSSTGGPPQPTPEVFVDAASRPTSRAGAGHKKQLSDNNPFKKVVEGQETEDESRIEHVETKQSDQYDAKHFGDVGLLDAGSRGITQ